MLYVLGVVRGPGCCQLAFPTMLADVPVSLLTQLCSFFLLLLLQRALSCYQVNPKEPVAFAFLLLWMIVMMQSLKSAKVAAAVAAADDDGRQLHSYFPSIISTTAVIHSICSLKRHHHHRPWHQHHHHQHHRHRHRHHHSHHHQRQHHHNRHQHHHRHRVNIHRCLHRHLHLQHIAAANAPFVSLSLLLIS